MGSRLPPDIESLDPVRKELALRRELARRREAARMEGSLAYFVRAAWPIIEPGTSLSWSWHLDVLCAYIQAFFDGRLTRLILNVPPGSMKSILFSVMGPAWKWAIDPSARMINITNEIGLASRDNRRMRSIIESSWFREYWGSKFALSGDQSEKLLFENTAKGFRQGLGITGSITGKRGNFLLIDDPVDASKAFSDVVIASANQTFDQALSSRLNDPTKDSIGLIMQRLRTNDLTGHLLAKKATRWTHVKIPMEYSGSPGYDPVRDLGPEYAHLIDPRREVGELLFPARFPASVVASLKEDLGEYGAAGQLAQDPSPLIGGILRKAGWRIWPKGKPLPTIVHAFASWDTAFTERDLEGSAYSACTVWGVWYDEGAPATNKEGEADIGRHRLLLLSAWWGRVDFPDLITKAREIEADKLNHDQDAHLVEAKASGLSMIQTLRRRHKVRILSYDPKRDGGGDKVARAYGVQDLFRAGMVYAPDKPWAQRVIEVFGEFPDGDALCKDLTDTVTQALTYLRKGWWIHHPDDDMPQPERSDDDEDLDDDDVVGLDRLPQRGRAYG